MAFDADAFMKDAKDPTARSGSKSKIDQLLSRLEKEDQDGAALVRGSLHDPEIPPRHLAETLTKHFPPVKIFAKNVTTWRLSHQHEETDGKE